MRYRTKIYTQIAALIVAGMILAGMTPCIAAAQATAAAYEKVLADLDISQHFSEPNTVLSHVRLKFWQVR